MYILGDRVTLLCGVNGVVRSRHLLIETSGVPPPRGRRRMQAVRIQRSDDSERGEIMVNIISLVLLRMSHSLHPCESNAGSDSFNHARMVACTHADSSSLDGSCARWKVCAFGRTTNRSYLHRITSKDTEMVGKIYIGAAAATKGKYRSGLSRQC